MNKVIWVFIFLLFLSTSVAGFFVFSDQNEEKPTEDSKSEQTNKNDELDDKLKIVRHRDSDSL